MKLSKLLKIQLRIGSIGFGGPLVTLSMMREAFCETGGEVPSSQYLEALSIIKLLPGPVSTLMATFLGYEVAGRLGALISACAFILPSFLMIFALAYLEHSSLFPEFWKLALNQILSQLSYFILAMILVTALKLLREAMLRPYENKKHPALVIFFIIFSSVLFIKHVPEILILLASVLLGFLFLSFSKPRSRVQMDSVGIFFIFFKAGLTVFGTGYMLLPYLQRVLVDQHVVSAADFLKSVTYGNLTPGPIVIASTYLGYVMNGSWGALAATLGIFAGPILLMILLFPFLKKLRGKAWMEKILLGLIPGVATTITLSLYPLFADLAWSKWSLIVFLISFFALSKGISSWKLLLVNLILSIGMTFA